MYILRFVCAIFFFIFSRYIFFSFFTLLFAENLYTILLCGASKWKRISRKKRKRNKIEKRTKRKYNQNHNIKKKVSSRKSCFAQKQNKHTRKKRATNDKNHKWHIWFLLFVVVFCLLLLLTFRTFANLSIYFIIQCMQYLVSKSKLKTFGSVENTKVQLNCSLKANSWWHDRSHLLIQW